MSSVRKSLLRLSAFAGLLGLAMPAFGGDAPAVPEDRVSFLQSLLPTAWQKRPNVRFNVFTELTPEGRKRPEASPDKPLYYTAPPGTLTQSGFLPAAGEKAPPWQDLQETMRKALAANGFFPTDDAHSRPDLLIVFTYGSNGTDIASLAMYPPDYQPPEEANLPVFPPPVTADELMPWIFKDPKATEDVIARARFIGGDKVAQALVTALKEEASNARMNATMSRNPGNTFQLPVSPDPGAPFPLLLSSAAGEATRNVLELAFHTCYFVTATAYDFKGVEQKKKIPLWQTRMTIEAQGVELREVLKPLIINAGAFLGRETPEAVTVQKRLDREGSVQIGTAEVVREPAPTPAPNPAGKR